MRLPWPRTPATTLSEIKSAHIKPPRWEYVVLGAIVLMLIIFGIAGMMVSKMNKVPKEISDKFVYSMLSNETSAAYEMTSEPFRQAKNKEQFGAIAQEYSQAIQVTPQSTHHQVEKTNTGILLATVEYEIPGTDENRLVVKLIKENDKWRVLNINRLP